ncbi:hypothetical protein ACVWW9_001180 [Agrococcus sp. UYP33]
MLRRLAAGVALVAALALAGCTPPEPTESTTPVATPTSDAELVMEATQAFADFYSDVDEQFGRGSASGPGLEEHATPAFAAEFAAQIQATLDRGEVSRGVLEVTALEITERSQSGLTAHMCTSAENVRTTQANGDVRQGEGLDAWTVTFERRTDGRLLVAVLDLSEDENICA